MNPDAATTARILLIEDDPLVREQVMVALRGAGHEVLEVPAVQTADNRPQVPDILILSLDLQSPSSWEIYAEWKARHPGLRTVAVTSVANRFGVARAVGMDALMEKPVEASLLLLVVGNLLEESIKSSSNPGTAVRHNFRYLTTADTLYWRGLRGRCARARQCRTAPFSN